MDVDGRIIEWNAQAEITFGWSRAEVLGKKLMEVVIPPALRQAHDRGLQRYLETGIGPLLDRRIEVPGLHRNGRELPLELSISAIKAGGVTTFNAFVSDVSERKKAHEKNIQTAKLASLGEMVAGVAHEINNPLSFVSNNVAVLQRDLVALRPVIEAYRKNDLAEASKLAEEIDLDHILRSLDRLFVRTRDGLKRIQQIVVDLRNFARLDGRAKARGVVDLELDLGPLPKFLCHAARINQVVMNLLSNAIDASPIGGAIRVRTRAGAELVTLEVIDQGPGVPPEIADRIFDPFFTTKPIGSGTGLGLSISYGIVKDHGGSIAFEKEPEAGARFVVTIPTRRAEKA